MKQTNPKDAVGSRKPPISTIPAPVLIELGNAMFEGHLKYGGHNWRAMGVRASVYYDATFRHLAAWWAGEDIDPDSGMSHITKAIAGLVILRDAMIHGMVNDDRPPKSRPSWMADAKARTLEILARYEATAKEPFMEKNRSKWEDREPDAVSRLIKGTPPGVTRDLDEQQDEGWHDPSEDLRPFAVPDQHPHFEDEPIIHAMMRRIADMEDDQS